MPSSIVCLYYVFITRNSLCVCNPHISPTIKYNCEYNNGVILNVTIYMKIVQFRKVIVEHYAMFLNVSDNCLFV